MKVITILAVLLASSATAKPYPSVTDCQLKGKVIKVTDGDTVNVLDKSKITHKIRLAGIDAPERGQPFGKASTKYLKKLVNQKTVCVSWAKKDRYKRLVGLISLNRIDINHEMVVAGLAWHYEKYQSEQAIGDRKLYSNSESKAKKERVGLWSMHNAIDPADWRKGIRVKENKPLVPYTCGSKRFCKQMSSCDEANYYLKSCGIGSLDGNSDGIPCNSICR